MFFYMLHVLVSNSVAQARASHHAGSSQVLSARTLILAIRLQRVLPFPEHSDGWAIRMWLAVLVFYVIVVAVVNLFIYYG